MNLQLLEIKRTKNFNITFDKLDLVIKAEWIDDSFEHAFGTHHQGYWECCSIMYNDFEIPLNLISDEIYESFNQDINK